MKKTGWSKESRQSRGYGAQWDKLRLIVLQRDCGLCQCQECKRAGKITRASEVHHIISKAKGGTDNMDNLQAINSECHKRETAAEQGRELKERRVIGLDGFPVACHG